MIIKRYNQIVFFLFALAALGGCDDPPPPSGCTSSAECTAGEVCIDGRCQAGGGDAGMDAGGGDAGLDGGPACPSAILCGSPAACCAEGEECVEGACLAACSSGVRCGDGLATCCGSDQVCVSGSCEDVGGPCADSYDCPEGDFCEPTLERCLPQFDPVTCELRPTAGAFEPILEWSFSESAVEPEYVLSTVMPAVIDLDGARELDGRLVPELIASFFRNGGTECRGVLRALRGDTGELLWTVRSVMGEELSACPTFALADLDADGAAEIVTMRTDGRITALRGDGSLMWMSTRADGSAYSAGTWRDWANAGFAVGDLDMDGSPEIAIGAVVVDARGVLRWERDGRTLEGDNNGYYGGLPLIADIDMDGAPELVAGRRAYEADGSPLWVAGGGAVTDGYPALGQFDADPQPEVVLVTRGQVYLLDGMSGAIDWGPIAIPGGGRGGPPTVADFDGDGLPEIGVAGGSSYSVYNPDGPTPVLWSRATQDESSNATGSAVFDFEGDGAAEVIYGDECYVRAYRGATGEVLLEIPNSSGTQHEYPVVADIDGDGNSEIAVVANDGLDRCSARYPGWDGQRHGVFVYGDANDRWVRTRRVWNQHTYHVTNVSPSGAIPATEANNWSTEGLNNYRQNVQGEGVFNAPDLKIAALEVSLRRCPEIALLRARVINEGNLGAPAGVPVSFYRGTPEMPGELLGTGLTEVPLLPGALTVVEVEAPLTGEAPYAFFAVVDDDGAGGSVLLECDEEDNGAGIGGLDCEIVF